MHFMSVESTSFASAIALADALMINKGLRLLDVCNNQIGDAGAAASGYCATNQYDPSKNRLVMMVPKASELSYHVINH